MKRIGFFLDIFQGDAANTAYRVGEILIDHFFVDADCLENLGTLIGLNRGNSHLGGNLHDSVQNRIVVIVHRRIVIFV